MWVEAQDGALPIRLWTADVEPGAMEQLRHLARLPFAVGAVCAMPDVHQGYGMPIGGVLATSGVVVPNAVGVDIGCGMLAAQLTLRAEDVGRDDLTAVLGEIRKVVPVGFAHHVSDRALEWEPGGEVGEREYVAARRQIGTLGGGNHFIELQAGDDGNVWVMIHSGSRNVGKQVADHYNRLARRLNDQWRSSVPAAWDLAFLPLDTAEGQAYVREMRACMAFAAQNRAAMASAVLSVVCDRWTGDTAAYAFDVAHNYAALEHHGRDVMVHRKGATCARAGVEGIIPGSQGTKSYLVVGKGNPLSFASCSHGAGRRMGRKEAQRTLNLADEQAKMADVVHAVRGASDLDEAPGAYKDIDVVMANQADLVHVSRTLRPLAVLKG